MFLARSPIPVGSWKQLESYQILAKEKFHVNMNLTRNLDHFTVHRNPRLAADVVIAPEDVRFVAQTKILGGNDQSVLHFDRGSVNRAYGEVKNKNSRCSLWMTVFRSMDWDRFLTQTDVVHLREKIGKNRVNYQQKMAREVILATKRPKSVQEFSKIFQEQVMMRKNGDQTGRKEENTQKFISIHFRYDKPDFLRHCERKTYMKVCRKFNEGVLFDVKNMTERITDFVQNKTRNPEELKKVYFASPPNLIPFVDSIKTAMKQQQQHVKLTEYIQIFTQSDLRMLVEKKFSDCETDKMRGQIHEFVSQTEQEIVLNSEIFLFSPGSTWSDGVSHERLAYLKGEFDRSVDCLF